uniref:Uncharacterized protein n=1 Tax=viral metagenome TaxID=1070528 RepID=A0A6C0I4R4_9ZZZZ
METLSEEQQTILNKVKEGYNVVVDACAGTGKTTLILSIAKALNRRKFLQMTYNSMLRHEVKERVQKHKIKNIDVHTFHSLAVKYYHPTAYTDTGIRHILCQKMPPLMQIEKFHVMVLDEAQDMTFLYYQFMCKVIADMGEPIQLLILGDYMQGLYEFKGADIRFLTFAQEIWENHSMLKSRRFQKCTMCMSYRITNQMCNFVNKVMLGEDRMEACRDGPTVLYACNSKSNLERIVFGEITKLLEQGVNPSDIGVLGASVKGVNSNIRQLENSLAERNIPCHVPMLENDKIDERVIHGKIVFSTFHCFKGRQRKYIFVIGFDQSYLRFYARTLSKTRCPNALYVGCTRATDRLYLLESHQFSTDRPLEFLKMTHQEMSQMDYITFKGTPRNLFSAEPEAASKTLMNVHKVNPTDLIKFIPESVIEELSPLLDKIFTKEMEYDVIDIPTIIETKRGFFEEVSDLNGIAIPCIYYDRLRQKNGRSSSLYDFIMASMIRLKPNEHTYLRKIVAELPETLSTVSEYLYLANVSIAVQETLYSKLMQMDRDEYTWISENIVDQCMHRLTTVIGSPISPLVEEVIIQGEDRDHVDIDTILAPYFDEYTKFRFTGRVDLITEDALWELKCTSKLSIDHMLQTIIYAWLWFTQNPEDTRSVKLFNIRTGETLRLTATYDELTTVMVTLLRGKYEEQPEKTDEEFVLHCINNE